MAFTSFATFVDDIKAFVLETLDNYVKEGRMNLDRTAGSFAQFAQTELSKYQGNEKVDHRTLKELCTWLDIAINEFQTVSVEDVKTELKYIIASGELGTGILVTPVQNLLVTGAGIEPTVPTPTTATPGDLTFDLASDLLPGQIGFNITDLKMYVRLGDTIYDISKLIGFEEDHPDKVNYRADEANVSEGGGNSILFSSELPSADYILTINDNGVGIEVTAQNPNGFVVTALSAGTITYHAIMKK